MTKQKTFTLLWKNQDGKKPLERTSKVQARNEADAEQALKATFGRKIEILTCEECAPKEGMETKA